MTSSHAGNAEQLSRLRDLKRPIIGYVGGVTRHVDIDLLETMARARPNWSWVYVGPIEIKATRLNRLETSTYSVIAHIGNYRATSRNSTSVRFPI